VALDKKLGDLDVLLAESPAHRIDVFVIRDAGYAVVEESSQAAVLEVRFMVPRDFFVRQCLTMKVSIWMKVLSTRAGPDERQLQQVFKLVTAVGIGTSEIACENWKVIRQDD